VSGVLDRQIPPVPNPVTGRARGLARQLKREIAEREAQIVAVFNSGRFYDILSDFMYKSGKGQQRALTRLKQIMPAKIELVRTRPNIIIWSVLACTEHLIADPIREGEVQDSVVMEHITTRMVNNRRFKATSGAWTIEIPDHALGRLYQRNPKAQGYDVLYQTHYTVLQTKAFKPLYRTQSVYIPTDGGLWAGHIIYAGTTVSQPDPNPELEAFLNGKHGGDGNNEVMCFFRARTYLDESMLAPNQEPAEQGNPCFGEGIMLPWPIRTVRIENNHVIATPKF
jgi:hypothetical protein